MANLTNEQIEQLQQQLKEKTEELKAIYSQLVEAGVVPLADDILDGISGGRGTLQPSFKPSTHPGYIRNVDLK